MTFRLTKTHRYWWPVKVTMPSADPARAGEVETQELKLLFVRTAASEAEGLSPEQEIDLLASKVADWSGVVDDDAMTVPFARETFVEALQQSWFRKAVYDAWWRSLSGEAARLKN